MRKFFVAVLSAILLLSVSAAGVFAAESEPAGFELFEGGQVTLPGGVFAYDAGTNTATVQSFTDGSYDFSGLRLSGKVVASDGEIKDLSQMTLSYSARFSQLVPEDARQGYYGIGLNLSSGTASQRIRLWYENGVYVQAVEGDAFTEAGNLDAAGEHFSYSETGSWLLEVRITGTQLEYYLDGVKLGASTAKSTVTAVGLYTCNMKGTVSEISLKVLGAEGWYDNSLPDPAGRTNYLADLADGSYEDNGFGGDPVTVSGGVLTGSAGKNGLYPMPSALSGKETLTIVKDGAQTEIKSVDASILSVIEMYPDAGSTHTLCFSPRYNYDSGALIYIAVGINVSGSAHGFNVFTEQRSSYGDFVRGNMISDVRTLMGSDYDLSKTDGSQRVKLYVLTKGGSLTLWMAYTGDGGQTYGEPVLIYDSISIVQTTAQFAPMFLNSGSGVYCGFEQYCLDEDGESTPPEIEFPSIEGLTNFFNAGDGVYPEAGGFGGSEATLEDGIFSGKGGANAKYSLPTYFTDKETVGVIRDGKLVNLQVNSLTFLSVVEMYPDEGSTHTLTFSPRGNSSTGANVLIRVGINVEGSAHGYNVFIEQRADGGEFIRENMIGDVRTLMGSDYDLSKTDGSQRVKLYAMTKGGSLTLWMAYSSDGGQTYGEPALIYENISIVATTLQCSPFFLDGGSGVFTGFALYNLENIEPAQPIELPVEQYPEEDPTIPPANTEQIKPELPDRPSGCRSAAAMGVTGLLLAAAAVLKRLR